LARYFGLGEETTFATPVTVTKFIDIVSESISADRATIYPETIRRGPMFARAGPYVPSGDVEMFVNAKNIAQFLKAAFGKVTSTADDAVSPVAYKHEFEISVPLPSYTVEIGHDVGTYARQLAGCAVSALELSATARELLAATISLIAAKESRVSASTPTFEDLEPFVFHEGAIEIAGAANNKVEAVTATLENTIPDDDFVLGSQFRPRLHVLGVSITGTLAISFEDWTEVERFYGAAGATSPQTAVGEASIKLTFTGPDTGSAVAGLEKYQRMYEIPKAVYNTISFNVDRRERIINEIDFTAKYDATLGSWAKATLINKDSSV